MWLSWLKIALRNLLKNPRRTLFTFSAVGVGFAAVNVFGGFSHYIFSNLRDAFIYAQGEGHLTVFRRGFLTYGWQDPAQFLITEEEAARIRAVCTQYPEVLLVSGHLWISGLVSNGNVSVIFLGLGRIPSEMQRIRDHASGMISRLKLFSGKPLEDELVQGVGVTEGLARKLNLQMGSDVIFMAPTVDGHVNALDAQVLQLFEGPTDAMNEQLVLVPLAFAQSLLDTKGVDRLGILLGRTEWTASLKARLEKAFQEQGMDLEVGTWDELSPMYRKNKTMFDTLLFFLFCIVSVMVVMSVVNTMTMTVVERTREIGTLRAIGAKRKRILQLFAMESGLLGAGGSLFGVVLTSATCGAIGWLKPTWIPANIPKRVPIEIHFVPSYILWAFLFLVGLTLLAGFWSSRKAANMNIVDALGHV